MKDATIICRCEDITQEKIQEFIRDGNQTIDEIKRACRCGMGPCQGRNCTPLVAQEISRLTGKPLAEVELPTFRPPIAPVTLGSLAGGEDND
ncbi:MAG TPA: (2Fe-2S)-binding protein [Patescibacteria group bacterium]|nr:(2Fe-2S)-binding protein [Patescibacteria group bacterium]